jgi:hypothetical protein
MGKKGKVRKLEKRRKIIRGTKFKDPVRTGGNKVKRMYGDNIFDIRTILSGIGKNIVIEKAIWLSK